jgi:hypothetical protein
MGRGQQAEPRRSSQPGGVLTGLQPHKLRQAGDGSGISENGGMEAIGWSRPMFDFKPRTLRGRYPLTADA